MNYLSEQTIRSFWDSSSKIQEILFSTSKIKIEMIGDIGYFQNFLTEFECAWIIDQAYEKAQWSKSLTTGEVQFNSNPALSPRQSLSAPISGNTQLQPVDAFLFQTFNSAVQLYSKHILPPSYKGPLGVFKDEGYTLLKYEEGGYYDIHMDHDPRTTHRTLSGLIYLNDNYSGGEIFFPRQDITIKPKLGSVVLFPSNYTHLHTSCPISIGTKYAIVTWWT